MFQGTGAELLILQGPLHLTGLSSAGVEEEGAAELYDVNTNKLKEPSASSNSNIAERFIISVLYAMVERKYT